MSKSAWTGRDAGVRKPMTGETPLSAAEVAVGLRDGVFKTGRPLTPVAQQTRDIINAAGHQGVSTAELRARFSEPEYQQARKAAHNAVLEGLARCLRSRRLSVYLPADVDMQSARAAFAARCQQRDAEQRAVRQAATDRFRQHEREMAGHRRSIREAQESERAARRQAAIEAAERRQAEKARLSDDRRQARASKQKTLMQRATKAINRLAAKVERKKPEKPIAAPKAPAAIDWSRAQVTKAEKPVGRYEALSAPGPFSSLLPGQYAFEAQSCAARALT